MSIPKLFGSRACPFAHRTRLVLGHKDVAFELIEVDAHAKQTAFPNATLYGKVPVLEHDGHRFVESNIINEYLDETFPSPPALPKAPALRALARIWIDFANTRLAPCYAKLLQSATAAQRAAASSDLLEAMARMEHDGMRQLGRVPFWLGEAPSLTDFAIYPWFERMAATLRLFELEIPTDATRLRDWQHAMQALPSVRVVANPAEFYVERYRQAVLARG